MGRGEKGKRGCTKEWSPLIDKDFVVLALREEPRISEERSPHYLWKTNITAHAVKHMFEPLYYDPGGHLKKCRSPGQEKCRKSASESAGAKRGAEESAEKSAPGSAPM